MLQFSTAGRYQQKTFATGLFSNRYEVGMFSFKNKHIFLVHSIYTNCDSQKEAIDSSMIR